MGRKAGRFYGVRDPYPLLYYQVIALRAASGLSTAQRATAGNFRAAAGNLRPSAAGRELRSHRVVGPSTNEVWLKSAIDLARITPRIK